MTAPRRSVGPTAADGSLNQRARPRDQPNAREELPVVDGDRYTDTSTRPGTPRWVKALGITVLAVVLLVVAVMVIGGGEHGPGCHEAMGDAGSETRVGTESPTAGGVGGPADTAEAARTIEVTALDTMAFEPAGIEVSAGEVVTFAVTNRGQAVHEFTLGDATMQHEHAEAMAHMPEGVAHALPNSITLQPGETHQLTWRFGEVGELEYACHEPGHYEAGMRGTMRVG